MPVTPMVPQRRIPLWIFIFGLVLSGATAIPLETEVRLLARIIEAGGRAGLAPWPRCRQA